LYIGDLDDPQFSWDGGDWSGNIPKGIGPDFPPNRRQDYGAFHAWVELKKCDWKQTDWGANVARVTKAEILDFIEFCYRDDPSYMDPERMLHWKGEAYLVNQLLEVRRFVSTLDDEKLYALVACEYY
jgi:hypothetical protein